MVLLPREYRAFRPLPPPDAGPVRIDRWPPPDPESSLRPLWSAQRDARLAAAWHKRWPGRPLPLVATECPVCRRDRWSREAGQAGQAGDPRDARGGHRELHFVVARELVRRWEAAERPGWFAGSERLRRVLTDPAAAAALLAEPAVADFATPEWDLADGRPLLREPPEVLEDTVRSRAFYLLHRHRFGAFVAATVGDRRPLGGRRGAGQPGGLRLYDDAGRVLELQGMDAGFGVDGPAAMVWALLAAGLPAGRQHPGGRTELALAAFGQPAFRWPPDPGEAVPFPEHTGDPAIYWTASAVLGDGVVGGARRGLRARLHLKRAPYEAWPGCHDLAAAAAPVAPAPGVEATEALAVLTVLEEDGLAASRGYAGSRWVPARGHEAQSRAGLGKWGRPSRAGEARAWAFDDGTVLLWSCTLRARDRARTVGPGAGDPLADRVLRKWWGAVERLLRRHLGGRDGPGVRRLITPDRERLSFGHQPEQPDAQEDALWQAFLRGQGYAPLADGLWAKTAA